MSQTDSQLNEQKLSQASIKSGEDFSPVETEL